MKRTKILPLGTPDEPLRPDRLQPIHVDPVRRAHAVWAIILLSLIFWIGVGVSLALGQRPW